MSPVPADVWEEVLRADPGATALQTPAYSRAVLRAGGGRDASRLYVLDDGRRVVLPLVRRSPLPGVRFDAAYPPGYGHGGALADGGLRASDVRVLLTDLVRSRAASTRIGAAHHTAEQWRAGDVPGVTEVERRVEAIDLTGGFEVVQRERFKRRTRELVRKADRLGVEVERDTTGRLMPVFYDIFRSWVDRSVTTSELPAPVARWNALRQEPWRKFEAVASSLGEACRVFVARHEGRPVASLITLVHGRQATAWRGYMLRDVAAPLAANHRVYAAAIEDACASGCESFDVGQSGGKYELERFKQSFGATPRQITDLRIDQPLLTRLTALEQRGEQAVARVLARGAARLRGPADR